MTPERVYAALLVAYPKTFRREYGEQMLGAFRQLHSTRRGGTVAFWTFILADLARSSLKAHVGVWSGSRQFAFEWAVTCAMGAVTTALAANALTWSLSYLYHPYLEGLVVPTWAYGASLGIGMGLVQSTMLHRRFRFAVLWIFASGAAAGLGLHVAVVFASVAGPVGYGLVLGSFVGAAQWLVLRTRVGRAGWWVFVSAAALSAAIASCAGTIRTTLLGMNAYPVEPVSIEPADYRAAIDFLVRGLYGPTSGSDLAVEVAVMATCGLVIAAVTARGLSALFARARQC